MPDPNDDAKPIGDARPAETEDVAQQRPRGNPDTRDAQGRASGGSLARDLEDEAQPGKGENQAGFLKEKDGEAGRNT